MATGNLTDYCHRTLFKRLAIMCNKPDVVKYKVAVVVSRDSTKQFESAMVCIISAKLLF